MPQLVGDQARDPIESICERSGVEYGMDRWPARPYQKPDLHHGALGWVAGTETPAPDGYFLPSSRPFTWPNVVTTWAERKVDVSTLARPHQLRAILYLICEKLCEEMTREFPDPVKLEFENACTQVWMDSKKKMYAYQLWDPSHPAKNTKIKTTGLADKRRDWTPWTRKALGDVKRILLTPDRPLAAAAEPVVAVLKRELGRLISGQVPLEDLVVTKKYKGRAAYKNDRVIHLRVVQKKEERERWTVRDNERVALAVVRRDGALLFERGETPEHIREHQLPLDYSYYLKNQFYAPMRKLLLFHASVIQFEAVYQSFVAQLTRQQRGVITLDEWSAGSRTLAC